jgi:hypothetical protein
MNDHESATPYIPNQCVGLFDALAAARSGDGEPLEDWSATGGAMLRKSLEAQGFDLALADEAVARVMGDALVALVEGRVPEREGGWIARVAQSARVWMRGGCQGGGTAGQRPTANGQRPSANGQRPTANGLVATSMRPCSMRG